MKIKKVCENTLKTEFPSLSQNESLARALVSSFIMQLNPTVSELADIKCAVSEAVTNCTVHAYRDTVGPIIMTVRSYNDRSVRIEIKDRGCGIEDIPKALEPLYTTDREGERSGMGFTVMESFTDKLRVTSRPSKGTKITLIKVLSDISPAT